MKKSLVINFIIVISLFITSCGGKVETPVVTSWKVYHDRFFGTELKYPENWMFSTDSKKIKIYSSQDVADKFYELYSVGSVSGTPTGVEIEYGSSTFKDSKISTLDEYKSSEAASWAGITFSENKKAYLEKKDAIEFTFQAQAGQNAKLQVRQIICVSDSTFYYLKYSGFNDYYEAYTSIFDSIVSSVILPRPKIKGKEIDESLPSEYFTTYDDEYFNLSHPDNFQPNFPTKKGETIYSVELIGYRQDCTILLDVLPAKDLTLEKVFDQNKNKYNTTSSSEITIGGNNAKVLTYSPVKNIERKVYFIVKNNKFYRIFVTWFKPMSKDFVPAFDKSIKSLTIK
ncbi:MAG: PsbP-related protein [Bacteroidetes bacterium]|nr:PsbP-related protein [Bacteroidota bacterium]